uniref:Peptidase M14 domain-containing protein n=1 Tax=Aplanochytrium stocchinoi TaxID=215587 RepID=A0A7S3V0P9_9STRA
MPSLEKSTKQGGAKGLDTNFLFRSIVTGRSNLKASSFSRRHLGRVTGKISLYLVIIIIYAVYMLGIAYNYKTDLGNEQAKYEILSDAYTVPDAKLTSPSAAYESIIDEFNVSQIFVDRDFFSSYHPYEEINAYMRNLSKRETKALVTLEKIGTSHEGRDIFCLRIQGSQSSKGAASMETVMSKEKYVNNENVEKTRGLLLLGGVHAREWLTIVTVLQVAARIVAAYGKVRWVTESIDKATLHVVPFLNPDGYVHTWKYDFDRDLQLLKSGGHADKRGGTKWGRLAPKTRLWRDNRRRNLKPMFIEERIYDETRTLNFVEEGKKYPRNKYMGSYGVDINRNWGYDGLTWGSAENNPNYIDFQGPVGISEPESIALNEYAQSRDDINAFLDIHCCSADVRAPEHSTIPYDEETAERIAKLGKEMTKAISMRHGTKYVYKYRYVERDFTARGTSSGWAYTDMGWEKAYIVELAAGFVTRASWIQNKSDEVFSVVETLLKQAAKTTKEENIRVLTPNSVGENVRRWNDFLNDKMDVHILGNRFTKETLEATKVWQQKNGLQVTGIVDPDTLAKATDQGFEYKRKKLN